MFHIPDGYMKGEPLWRAQVKVQGIWQDVILSKGIMAFAGEYSGRRWIEMNRTLTARRIVEI